MLPTWTYEELKKAMAGAVQLPQVYIIQAATVSSGEPAVTAVHIPVKDVIGAIFAEGLAQGSDKYDIKYVTPDPATGPNPPDPAPRQSRLFTFPPVATPCGWKIMWRWKDGIDWATGEPRETSWSIFGGPYIYHCRKLLQQTLRKLRYGNRHRKVYRTVPVEWDLGGDIKFWGPPSEPPKPPTPGQSV